MPDTSELLMICTGKIAKPTNFNITECMQFVPVAMDVSAAERVFMTTIFSFLSFIGIIGNILVITVVFKVKGMKTPTNCYLVSLAFADTLFFVASAPTELAYLHISEYVFGSVGCAILSYLPYLAINASSLSITAFTVERYIGICHPYRARKICTVKRAQWIILIIWVFSILYNSPWLFLASIMQDDDGKFCDFALNRDSWAYKLIYVWDFLAFYSVPMVLNIIIYGRIAITLSQCGERLKDATKKAPSGTLIAHSDFQVSGRRSVTKGKNQVVKMLAVVVFVFATCWLPYRAVVMYNSFARNKYSSDSYFFFAKTLIFVNCAINPILYNLMSKRFRTAFRSLFKQAPLRLQVTTARPTVISTRKEAPTYISCKDDASPVSTPL